MLELRKVYGFHFLYNILREMMLEEEHIAVQHLVHNDWKNELSKFDHVVHSLGSLILSCC